MVAQQDSRAAVRISKAVKSDSAAMKSVGVLTLVFLPSTFVSVRGMQIHQTGNL